MQSILDWRNYINNFQISKDLSRTNNEYNPTSKRSHVYSKLDEYIHSTPMGSHLYLHAVTINMQSILDWRNFINNSQISKDLSKTNNEYNPTSKRSHVYSKQDDYTHSTPSGSHRYLQATAINMQSILD